MQCAIAECWTEDSYIGYFHISSDDAHRPHGADVFIWKCRFQRRGDHQVDVLCSSGSRSAVTDTAHRTERGYIGLGRNAVQSATFSKYENWTGFMRDRSNWSPIAGSWTSLTKTTPTGKQNTRERPTIGLNGRSKPLCSVSSCLTSSLLRL